MSDELLNVGQVAELLQCSEDTVYRLVRNKKMPRPTKIGQLSRWPKARLDEWIRDDCPPQE